MAGGKPAPLGAPPAGPTGAAANANGAPAAPRPAPAPAAAPEPDLTPEPETWTITANPLVARVGNQITLALKGFPKATTYDLLIVVPAGTPDLDPMSQSQGGDMKILDRTYASNLMDGSGNETTWKVGPHAPGRYEVRWMTRLFNDDGRLEVKARAPIAWR